MAPIINVTIPVALSELALAFIVIIILASVLRSLLP